MSTEDWNFEVRNSIAELIDELNQSVADADKHGKGNSAAGTRLRKVLMTVANRCKELRVQIQEEKKARTEAKKNA
tara:strand:- start:8023 stop:8247 length:225 start_codon:yes stop_codon:yes gene_type:complete